MTVQRKANRGPKTGSVGPNKTEYCVECQCIWPNGYWIHDRVSMGERGIFICDECLAKAKRYGAATRLLIDRFAQEDAKS
jgi:hypothetical protein